MKHFLVLVLLTLTALFCFDGCSTVRQDAQSVVFDAKTGNVTTNSISARVMTTGNAKTAVESLTGRVGKTISIGAAGVSQETDLAQTITAVADAVGSVFAAGVQAGAKAVVPKP